MTSVVSAQASLDRSEEADTDDTPGAPLVTAELTESDVLAARDVAERTPRLRAVLRRQNVAEVRSAAVTGPGGELEAILLTYELNGVERGRPDWVVLPAQAQGDAQAGRANYGLVVRSAIYLDVIIEDGEVTSALPGFGTTYEEPVPGDWVLMADGTRFVFEDGNFLYHADEGAIEILGLESHQ